MRLTRRVRGGLVRYFSKWSYTLAQDWTFDREPLIQGKVSTEVRPGGVTETGLFENGLLVHGTKSSLEKTIKGEFFEGKLVRGAIFLTEGDKIAGEFNAKGELIRGRKLITLFQEILGEQGEKETKRCEIDKEGDYKDGKLIRGKIIDLQDRKIREGIFEDEKLKEGVMIFYLNNKKCVFEGEFDPSDDERPVKGKMTLTDGLVWEGSFDRQALLESGSAYYRDGTIKTGTFKGGRLIKGKLERPDGTIIEGTFDEKENLKSGTSITMDKKTSIGEFERGQLRKGKVMYPNGFKAKGYFDSRGKISQGIITNPSGHIDRI